MKGRIAINGNEYEFKEGETILAIARRNGIDIPVLCYLKDITETGACRVCLVEVEGVPVPVAACATFASEGMKVRTDTEEVKRLRLNALEFILLKHPLECEECENSEDCVLRDLAKKLGVSEAKSVSPAPRSSLMDWNMLWYNRDSCVLCQRCSKVCSDVAGCFALEIISRGSDTHMEPVQGDLDCDFCGVCVDVCPVGAIIDKPFKHSVKVWSLSNVTTACPFCPVGCRVNYGVYGGAIHRVRRSGEGYTCSKGRYGFKFIESDRRVTVPLVKKDGVFVKTPWIDAMEKIYAGLTKNGAENSLIVAGSRLTNEELYNFKSLADKTGMAFLTEAEIYFGRFMRMFRDKFGHFESVGSLKKLESAEVVFVIGADFARECVGVKWSVLKAASKKEAKIITIGLQRYEYDEKTYASIIADYGDFAGELEKIKNGTGPLYVSIRNYAASAKSVAIIVGNEYFGGEEDQEAVLAFADFIGPEKLSVFIAASDKVNYAGALSLGGATLEEIEKRKPKAVLAMAVNPDRGKLEELADIFKEVEFYATPEIFVTGSVKRADVVLPVQASLETDGTYVTLDGRLDRICRVVEPPPGTKSNSEIASLLAGFFRKKIEADHKVVFEKHSGVFGFPPEGWDGGEEIYRRKEETFNKTPYEYKEKPNKHKIVYVNPRHHEGVLTRVLQSDPADTMPLFPGVEVVIKPGASRSALREENIAKGVTLMPRGKI